MKTTSQTIGRKSIDQTFVEMTEFISQLLYEISVKNQSNQTKSVVDRHDCSSSGSRCTWNISVTLHMLLQSQDKDNRER